MKKITAEDFHVCPAHCQECRMARRWIGWAALIGTGALAGLIWAIYKGYNQ